MSSLFLRIGLYLLSRSSISLKAASKEILDYFKTESYYSKDNVDSEPPSFAWACNRFNPNALAWEGSNELNLYGKFIKNCRRSSVIVMTIAKIH